MVQEQQVEETRKSEIAALGKDGPRRLANLDAWANANLPADTVEGFRSMIQTAESVKAVEALVSLSRNAPMSPDAGVPAQGVTEADVKAMQFETDQYGTRRISSDMEFRKEYERKRDQVYGTGEFKRQIG